MKLYRTHEGVWVGTQADAGKKGTWEQVEVPVDKAGLLDFLNDTETRNATNELTGGDGLTLVEPKVSSPLNLAPLKHGAGWRESVAGMVEAVALMNLPTALRWAEATISRVRVLFDAPEDEAPAEDNGDDLI